MISFFKKIKNNVINSAQDENFILENKLFEYIYKYDNGLLDVNELKLFCQLMVEYCKRVEYSEVSLDAPKVIFKSMDYEKCAGYDRNKNSVVFNEKFLERVLSRRYNMATLISSIGHEMTHYFQNSKMLEYDALSAEEQQLVELRMKNLIDSYKNHVKLDKKDIKMLHKLLAPYLGENELPGGYVNLEDFYYDISFASYYTALFEKEARDGAFEFALKVYQKFLDSKYNLSMFGQFEFKKFFATEQNNNDEEFVKYKVLYDKFSEMYRLDEDKILEVVKRIESDDKTLKNIDITSYDLVLRFLIKNKTIEQKESLLKNAIFNGYQNFALVLVDSMQNDIEFKVNKNNISNYVKNCLTGNLYAELNFSPKYKVCCVDYSEILNQNDYEDVVVNLVKNDLLSAKCFVCFSEKTTSFSLESLLKCQQNIFRNNYEERMDYDKRCNIILFFEELFKHVKIDDKIKYLKSKKLKPDIIELLIYCIMNDSEYQRYREEFEFILLNYNQDSSFDNNNFVEIERGNG